MASFHDIFNRCMLNWGNHEKSVNLRSALNGIKMLLLPHARAQYKFIVLYN